MVQRITSGATQGSQQNNDDIPKVEGINQVIMMGYLSKEPTLRELNNENKTAVYNGLLMIPVKYQDYKTKEEKWRQNAFRIQAWGKIATSLADVAGEIGDWIKIEGSLSTRTYKKPGTDQIQFVTEVKVLKFESIAPIEKNEPEPEAEEAGGEDELVDELIDSFNVE